MAEPFDDKQRIDQGNKLSFIDLVDDPAYIISRWDPNGIGK